MKQDINKELDKLQNNERKPILVSIFFIIVFMVIIGIVYFPIKSNTVFGHTMALTALHTDEGSKFRVKVKLDNGKTILAIFPKHVAYRYGKKGELLEGHTLVGNPTYRFVRYVQ
jgi:hypothetical protein